MKSTGKLLIFVLTLLALTASAYAQSPREQLNQMVQQLQQTPNDNALREKIIKLALEIKPAPSISEEANRAFVKGNVFQKEAKDVSGYELAISAYRDALRIAPWWGDAYFNLGAALTSANKFDEAIVSLKLYMASVPVGGREAREVQNKIYALEANSEMANTQARVKTQEQQQRIGGIWRNERRDSNGRHILEVLNVRQTPEGKWKISQDVFLNKDHFIKGEPWNMPETIYEFVDGALIFKFAHHLHTQDLGLLVCSKYDGKGTVSADGKTLNFTHTNIPLADWSERCPSRGRSYVETYTR